jgi:hypothetical protein
MKDFNQKHLDYDTARLLPRSRAKIKVCVIDTGLDTDDTVIRGESRRIVAKRSWVSADTHDSDGHGTHIGRLILGNTSFTDLLVAKVTEKRTFDDSGSDKIVEVSATLAICKQWRSHKSRQSDGLLKRAHISYHYHWDFTRISKT